MQPIREAATEFLAKNRIAVTGVSRTNQRHGSNSVFQRLRSRGYEVFPVNPHAQKIDDVPCYPTLAAIPGGVEAVVIGTRPELADETVRDCVELGIQHVWMHRGPGQGSVSKRAANYGRNHGLQIIDGGCPLMFGPTADVLHKCFRPVLTLTGSVPRHV